jgi:hypothetical protein
MNKTTTTKTQSKTQKPAATKINLKELPVKKEVKGGGHHHNRHLF